MNGRSEDRTVEERPRVGDDGPATDDFDEADGGRQHPASARRSAPSGGDHGLRAPGANTERNTIAPELDPLPGEAGLPDVTARRRASFSAKGLLAVALLLAGVVAVVAFGLAKFGYAGKAAPAGAGLTRDKPTAASTEPRRLDMALAAPAIEGGGTPRIPAIDPNAGLAEPIGVRRTGAGAPPAGGTGGNAGGNKGVAPEDAPVMLVSTRPGAVGGTAANPPMGAAGRGGASLPTALAPPSPDGTQAGDPLADDPLAATTRNLQDYQRQLQGLLGSLTQSAALATGSATGRMPSAALLGGSPGGGSPAGLPALGGIPNGAAGATGAASALFGGQLPGSSTPKVAAAMLGNRSLTLPKGTAFTCALKTKVVSATSGLIGCQVQRNVYSDDGRVLLVERGSHLDGEYRVASLKPGTVRIPVLWTRIRTPLGVVVDIDSPGTGQLGEGGIDGYVDNRWVERIGAAMLLSLIDDSVKLVIQNQTESTGGTVVLPSTTSSSNKLAERVLESTINIAPLIYRNQGGIVGIYVARDVDFSSVYELRPVARDEDVAAGLGTRLEDGLGAGSTTGGARP